MLLDLKKPLRYVPPLHTLLLCIYPSLVLIRSNIVEVSASHTIGCFAISILSACLLFIGFRMFLKYRGQAGLLASLIIILLLTFNSATKKIYGWAGIVLWGKDFKLELPLLLLLQKTTLFIFLILLALILTLLVRQHKKSSTQMFAIHYFLNVFSIALVLFQLSGIIFNHPDSHSALASKAPLPIELETGTDRTYPNIFFIILDAYARDDVLDEIYGYDNTEFLDELENLGFFVSRDSWANYNQTAFSLAASLNINYLDDLIKDQGPQSQNRSPLIQLIGNNLVFRTLQQIGYEIAVFPSGATIIQVQNALKEYTTKLFVNEFEQVFISQTIYPIITDILEENFGVSWVPSQFELHRSQISYTLDHLHEATESDAPRFIMAHILCPHPPFVFNAEGRSLYTKGPFHFASGNHIMASNKYRFGYTQQIKFLNSRIIKAIKKIRVSSTRPTVIIIQGDHGPGSQLFWNDPQETNMREKFGVLNAIYFPGQKMIAPNNSFALVNTFRLFFNTYFKTGLPMLEQHNHYSSWAFPYNFHDVTQRLTPKK